MPQPNRFVTARLTFRKGSTIDWQASDPILMAGEPSIDTSVNKLKIGDGIKRWSELSYVQNLSTSSNLWENDLSGKFPSDIDTTTEAINFVRDEQLSIDQRVTALETEIDGGTF